jgi:hypothetical protein
MLYDLASREGIYTREDDVAKLALLCEYFGTKAAL